MNEHLIYFILINFICGTFKWQVVVSGNYICFFHKYIKKDKLYSHFKREMYNSKGSCVSEHLLYLRCVSNTA